MILVGSQRAGASALADHLANQLDNDHVQVFERRDFMAEDLHGALEETQAISKVSAKSSNSLSNGTAKPLFVLLKMISGLAQQP